MGRVSLPYYGWQLTARISKHGYPEAPTTIGQHIIKRRIDLGLTRKAAAERLGIDEETARSWEAARTQPAIGHLPHLISYLGYNPLPAGKSRGSRIRRERVSRGPSRKALADILGLDEATVRRMEEDVKDMAAHAIRAICHELDVEV